MRRRGRRIGSGALAAMLMVGISLVGFSPAGAATLRHPDKPGATRADTSSLPAPRADLTDPVIPAGTPITAAVNWLQGALSIRSSQLQTLSDDVTAAHWLTTQDASALTNIVSSATSGMNALTTKAGNDATLGAVRNDASSMIDNYHVFSIITPQVKLTIDIDRELANIGRFDSLEPSVAAAIATLQQSKHGAADAAAVNHDLVQQISAATSALSGLPQSIVALSSSGDPTSAQDAVTNAQGSSETARGDITTAEMDLRHIVLSLGAQSFAFV